MSRLLGISSSCTSSSSLQASPCRCDSCSAMAEARGTKVKHSLQTKRPVRLASLRTILSSPASIVQDGIMEPAMFGQCEICSMTPSVLDDYKCRFSNCHPRGRWRAMQLAYVFIQRSISCQILWMEGTHASSSILSRVNKKKKVCHVVCAGVAGLQKSSSKCGVFPA